VFCEESIEDTLIFSSYVIIAGSSGKRLDGGILYNHIFLDILAWRRLFSLFCKYSQLMHVLYLSIFYGAYGSKGIIKYGAINMNQPGW
jgi:hypothetical protein